MRYIMLLIASCAWAGEIDLPQSCRQTCTSICYSQHMPYVACQNIQPTAQGDRFEPCVTCCKSACLTERMTQCLTDCQSGESPCKEIAPRAIMHKSFCSRIVQ